MSDYHGMNDYICLCLCKTCKSLEAVGANPKVVWTLLSRNSRWAFTWPKRHVTCFSHVVFYSCRWLQFSASVFTELAHDNNNSISMRV